MAYNFKVITSGGLRWKLSVSYGLSCGALPIPYGHLPFAYAYGNHERICGCDDLVEMYVSYSMLLTRMPGVFLF